LATLREIRRRINSVKSTQQITKAMKMVSAAKLRKAQDNILKARPYAFKLRDVIADISMRVDRAQHPLLAEREPKNVAYILLTGDRGLCGSFNSNIIKKGEEIFTDLKDIHYELITIGSKGRNHFKKRDYNVTDEYINFFNELDFSHAQDIGSKIISHFTGKKLDKVILIYNEFKSAIQQNLITEEILPIKPAEKEEDTAVFDFIYEPDPDAVLEAIIPLHINIQIWRVLLESYAAEQGARMTAMESATDNAAEMIDILTLDYNRTRQAAITREITEIVGGAEALV